MIRPEVCTDRGSAKNSPKRLESIAAPLDEDLADHLHRGPDRGVVGSEEQGEVRFGDIIPEEGGANADHLEVKVVVKTRDMACWRYVRNLNHTRSEVRQKIFEEDHSLIRSSPRIILA